MMLCISIICPFLASPGRSNGKAPVSMQYSTTPQLQMSALRASYVWSVLLVTTSGAMYMSVPAGSWAASGSWCPC